MMKLRNYSEVKKYINEGDVLLFRGKGFISKLIGSSSESPYTHVGVASWINGDANTDDGILECVEFREGSLISGIFGLSGGGGGRSVNLGQEIQKMSGQIDVYRANPIFFNYDFNEEKRSFLFSEKPFNGKSVTRIMRKMTGLPYGWKRIWWMAKHKFILLRIMTNTDSLIIDKLNDIVYPVCSTAVAYAFNSNGFDLVKNRSDEWTEPADIAQSTQLNYLFTLQA